MSSYILLLCIASPPSRIDSVVPLDSSIVPSVVLCVLLFCIQLLYCFFKFVET